MALFHVTVLRSDSITDIRDERNSKKNPGSRTEMEAIEYCLLAVPHGLLTLLSDTTQKQLSKSGLNHIELGSPPSIINQEYAPQSHPQDNIIKVFSELKFPLSRYA